MTLKWDVILNPSEALRRGVKNSALAKKILAHASANKKILRLRRLRMTLKWDVILNPSEALRRGVKNLGVGREDPRPCKREHRRSFA